MHRLVSIAAFLLILSPPAHAQWTLETSNTTADLRGIHSIGNGVAWASGTNGTILRTEDSGYVWQSCSIPPGAEKLDFRGIQAFDANTAIVMSSGTGDLSRLYKTTDGCHSWKLVFTNPNSPEGFSIASTFPRSSDQGMITRASALCSEIRWAANSPSSKQETAVTRGIESPRML